MSSSDLIPNPEVHTLEVATSTEGEDETCVTYVMHHEDHTIGNSLRYMIMKNPEVRLLRLEIAILKQWSSRVPNIGSSE